MQPKVKRIYLPKLKFYFSVFFFAVAIAVLAKGVLWMFSFSQATGLTPTTLINLVFGGGTQLKTQDNRTNILLLGIGGGEHPGADLTDTMMVLSLGKRLALISIPRDIWSDTLKDKVNSAYHYGEEKSREAGSRSAGKKGGLILSKAIVEDVIGLPIHYSLVIDFSGFTEIIDFAGGVTFNVLHGFTDKEFPIEGKEDDSCGGDPTFACRYEVVHFDSGVQTVDGKRALQYVRSRQAAGEEGSDFARARRQQEILVALKEKLLRPGVWLSPTRAKTLIAALEKATDTDMNIGEFLTVGKAIAEVNEEDIQRISLDDLLYTPPAIWYGRYVLLPKEDFESIHEDVLKELKNET